MYICPVILFLGMVDFLAHLVFALYAAISERTVKIIVFSCKEILVHLTDKYTMFMKKKIKPFPSVHVCFYPYYILPWDICTNTVEAYFKSPLHLSELLLSRHDV